MLGGAKILGKAREKLLVSLELVLHVLEGLPEKLLVSLELVLHVLEGLPVECDSLSVQDHVLCLGFEEEELAAGLAKLLLQTIEVVSELAVRFVQVAILLPEVALCGVGVGHGYPQDGQAKADPSTSMNQG